MLFSVFLMGSLAYVWLTTPRIGPGDQKKTRNTKFKDPYFPVESGAWDHAWRHGQGVSTYNPGSQIGKLEYANPLPYAVNSEFMDSLNETNFGYALESKSLLTARGPVNVEGQRKLIEESFALEEHPRLDLTRQDVTKGRHRRSQWSFVPGRD